jgi:L-ascorbate metabolism protein UlaG (beta-lactamase superfamily)
MEGTLRWLGHSWCEFTTANNKVVLFDPWTKDDGNPGTQIGIMDIEKVDLVLVSHDHFDHIGSALQISNQTGALVGGACQTMRRLMAEGLPEEQVVNFGRGYMPGGGADLDWITIRTTPAYHASDTGIAMGHIVIAADGTTIYHAGDTGLFSEMEIYARLYPIDLALLPIGGVFTMDAKQASFALTLLKPKAVVPIHYKSFPIVAQSAAEFVELARKAKPDVKILPLEVGEPLDLASL